MCGGAAKNEIEDLQVLQNKAAPFRTRRKETDSKLEWLTVHQFVAFHWIVTVYKIRRTGEPEYLFEKLSKENGRGNIVFSHTKLHQRSFIQYGATL